MADFKKDTHHEDMWLEYLRSTIYTLTKDDIASKSLGILGIEGIISHLPFIGVEGSLSSEGYEKYLNIVSECLISLWDYCKEMCFVDKEATLDAFVRSGLDFNFFKDEDALPYTHDVPKDFEKLAQWIESHYNSL